MKIIYIIGGVSCEYGGWLRVGEMKTGSLTNVKPNCDQIRQIVIKHVNDYMNPAGQKYQLFWSQVDQEPITSVYQKLIKDKIPRYRKTGWFNTDVWTVRKVLNHKVSLYNCRRLKPLAFARYLNRKYRMELNYLLKYPNNSKEQRFKRNFYNEWNLSSIDFERIRQIVRMFASFLLIRNLVSSVPKGCRKMLRKLIPLRVDDLSYDLKLLGYKFDLNLIIHVKHRINSLSDKPFGTAEFTNQYLIKHVKFLQIFDSKLLKRYFNL